MMRRWPAILVVAVSILSYSWAVTLTFQFDDYWVVPASKSQLELQRLSLEEPLQLDTRPDSVPAPLRNHYQPVLWGMLALEMESQEPPLDPAVFHLVSLLLHALTCLLFWFLLRRHFPVRVALSAALLLAVHPAGSQAVTWISARGDLLMTLFGVLGFLAIGPPQRPSRPRELLAGIMVALATASKVTGLLVFLAIVPLVIGRAGGWRRVREWRLGVALLLAPLLILLWARSRFVGGWLPSHMGGATLTLDSVPGMLQGVPDLFAYLLVPWNPMPGAALAPPALILVGVAAILLTWGGFLAGSLLMSRVHTLQLAFGAWILGLLLIPALFAQVLHPSANSEQMMGRTLYPLMPAVAFLVAVLLDGKRRHIWLVRPLQAIRFLFVAAVSVVAIDAVVHTARLELHNRDLVRTAMSQVEGAGSQLEEEATLVVIGGRLGFAGIPGLGGQIAPAMSPPFRSSRVRVVQAATVDELVRWNILTTESGPVRVLRWRGPDADGPPEVGPLLPALPTLLPPMTAAGTHRWEPREPVTPRAVRALRIPLRPGAEGRLHLILHTDKGALRRNVEMEAEAVHALVILDADPEWVLSWKLQAVEVAPAEDDSSRVSGAPILLREYSLIEVSKPSSGGRLPFDELPRFHLRGLPRTGWLRGMFNVTFLGTSVPMTYVVPIQQLPRMEDGTAVFCPDDSLWGDQQLPPLRWTTLQPLYARFVRPLAIKTPLQVSWRFEVLSEDRSTVRARSGVGGSTFEPR